MKKKIHFIVTKGDGTTKSICLCGRKAWALSKLIQTGEKGCTPIDQPAPRWASYIHQLKNKYGLRIETINEPHGGPFAGTHARYVLRDKVRETLEGETS